MSRKSKPKKANKPDLPPHHYVRTAFEWEHCLRHLKQQQRIAIDLEANSMYAYREQICLVQISIPEQDFILDPLGDFNLDPLGELIEDERVEKVFHAAEYDLILMRREYGWKLCNLFDTMWAARILGYARVGLANILSETYGVTLDKRYQRANWCKRPLSPAQLAYAQADTHYLLELRDYLAEALEVEGRLAEAQEIFAEQCQVDVPDLNFDPDSFWSINGINRLSPSGKAIVRALYIFRDEQARRRDQPHFKILSDRTLLELARHMPETEEKLHQIHGMTQGQIRRYGKALLRIIAENRNAPAPRRPKQPPKPSDEVLNRYDKLRTWRKERGEARGVESDVILSRDALWEIARVNPQTKEELAEIDKLGPWRQKMYGDEILSLLTRGNAKLK